METLRRFNSYRELVEFQMLEQSREKGRQEGRQEGQCEATQRERRNTVQLLLEHTGKPVPPKITLRLAHANSDELKRWMETLIDGTIPPELNS